MGMETFSSIISLWPSHAPLAEDMGVPPGHIAVWKRRNSIPARYWTRLVAGASKRDIEGVTLEALARIAERNLEAAE
jgi:hypothetical protein